jgi:hypothetical protein
MLIEGFKADIDYRTKAGETPLMAASKRDKV